VLPTVDPHNQYLFFLAEQGIFGLIAFFAFIGAALLDRGDGTRARVVAVALLLAWCATSLLSSHFKTFSEGHLLTLFLGAMLARPVPGRDDALVPRVRTGQGSS
jgi:membrane associated rhomboid family serine protease